MKLDLGSGTEPAEGDGWTTVDLYVAADVRAPLWGLPFEPETIDEIRCSHALEHVTRALVAPTLSEWHRVLRPLGRLTVEVPDLDWVCRRWLEQPDVDGLNYLFGNQEREGQAHLTGFIERTLREAIVAAGFAQPDIEHVWSHGAQCLLARTGRG